MPSRYIILMRFLTLSVLMPFLTNLWELSLFAPENSSSSTEDLFVCELSEQVCLGFGELVNGE